MRLCPVGATKDMRDTARFPERRTCAHQRVFTIELDAAKQCVSVRVPVTFARRNGARGDLRFDEEARGRTSAERSPDYDRGEACSASIECSNASTLRQALYAALGLGYRDVILYVPGFNHSWDQCVRHAAKLALRTSNDKATVGVFSFGSQGSINACA